MKRLIALLLTVVVTLSLCACASSTPSGKLPGKPSDSYVGGNLGQQDEDAGKESQAETQHSDKKTSPSDEQTVSPEPSPKPPQAFPCNSFPLPEKSHSRHSGRKSFRPGRYSALPILVPIFKVR